MPLAADSRRLDVAMVEEQLAETRARAQALILGGDVLVDGERVSKPATMVPREARLSLAREPMPYVSRGGLKLAAALDEFNVTVQNAVCLDVGASTGGFTDVLLRRGASRVFAVDVGYGQLAWTLRNDPRVEVMERVNIRYLDALPDEPRVIVSDVSFISLRLVLPAIERLIARPADAVVLIKPQFEAGKERVGKRGVVRDPRVWIDVLHTILHFALDRGWRFVGLIPSPITGPAGNVEFLAHLQWATELSGSKVDDAVAAAVHAVEPRHRPVGGPE